MHQHIQISLNQMLGMPMLWSFFNINPQSWIRLHANKRTHFSCLCVCLSIPLNEQILTELNQISTIEKNKQTNKKLMLALALWCGKWMERNGMWIYVMTATQKKQ